MEMRRVEESTHIQKMIRWNGVDLLGLDCEARGGGCGIGLPNNIGFQFDDVPAAGRFKAGTADKVEEMVHSNFADE